MKLLAFRLPRVAQRLVLPALLLAGASAQADLNFTFTGINGNFGGSAGYIQGQSYTFTFVVNGNFAVGTNTFTSDTNIWGQTAPTDDTLFTSISGSGIGGSLTGTSLSVVYVTDNATGPGEDYFQFIAAGDGNSPNSSTPSGLTANGAPLSGFNVYIQNAGNILNLFPGSYVAPQSVFSAVNSTSTFGSGPLDLFLTDGNAATFNLTSFTIENTATEVPFGVDSTVGLAALGLAGAWKLRRRRKQAAVNAAN